MTPIEFLRARLDEDEAIARATDAGDWDSDVEGGWFTGLSDTTRAHIARHDPARVLREVAAKRAILTAYLRVCDLPGAHGRQVEASVLRTAVLMVIGIYEGHVDYNPGWMVAS